LLKSISTIKQHYLFPKPFWGFFVTSAMNHFNIFRFKLCLITFLWRQCKTNTFKFEYNYFLKVLYLPIHFSFMLHKEILPLSPLKIPSSKFETNCSAFHFHGKGALKLFIHKLCYFWFRKNIFIKFQITFQFT